MQWNETPTTVPNECRVHIRWMIRRDMPEVLDAELLGSAHPWCEDDFLRALRERNTIGMVAEHGETVICHMVYELHERGLVILNFTVHPNWRRRGVGSAMIAKLRSKLSVHQRKRFSFMVRESNLGGLMFLKSQGGVAVSVIRDHFDGEDGIKMVFRL